MPMLEDERWKLNLETKLLELNNTLRENFVDTKIITIKQWNEIVAPKLSGIAMAIEGVRITARTYKLPENYF